MRSPACPTSRSCRRRSCSSAPTSRSRSRRRRSLCDTKDRASADVPRGRVARPLLQREVRQGKLHGVYVFGNDSKSARDASFVSLGAHSRDIGHQVRRGLRPVRAAAPQSAYTPVIQEMKSSGSNYGQAITAVRAMVLMRKEAALQGLTGVKVWDCGVRLLRQAVPRAPAAPTSRASTSTRCSCPSTARRTRRRTRCSPTYVKYTGADKRRRLRGVRLGGGHRLPRRGERRR